MKKTIPIIISIAYGTEKHGKTAEAAAQMKKAAWDDAAMIAEFT